MKCIYHLSTCSTNQRILKELQPGPDFTLIDIKTNTIDEETLDFLKEKLGTYEALFSKKAIKYRALGLDKQALTEADYKRLLREEYTFLKRPFIINGSDVFVGNSPKTIAAAKSSLSQK